jgi:hypothetical protein
MKNYLFFLPILFLSSCASYKYDNEYADKSISVTSNVDGIYFFEKKTSRTEGRPDRGDAKNKIYNYSINKLKRRKTLVYVTKDNYDTTCLVIKRRPRGGAILRDALLGVPTLMTPFIVDVFRSDFYVIKNSYKSHVVNLKFNQKFMSEEFAKIKASSNPADFTNYLSLYPHSKLAQTAMDKKDSNELLIAVNQNSEKAIIEYLASHKPSRFKTQAETIKKQIVEARTAFEAEKNVNTVEGYEAYLKKYPYSLQRKEAHIKLIDAAEKVAFNAPTVQKQVNYVENYLLKFKEFLEPSVLDSKNQLISNAIDEQIIKENNPKKTYNYEEYKKLWSTYMLVYTKFGNELKTFEKCENYRAKIANELLLAFNKLSNETSQKQFLVKSEIDFPGFATKEESFLVNMIDQSNNKNGVFKLYNHNFIGWRLEHTWEGDPVKGKDFVEYQGKEYPTLTNLNYEELTFLNDKLIQIKLFNNKTPLVDLKYYDDWTKLGEASFYLNGKLVRTEFTPNRNTYYFYEYDNGVNLSLQELERKIANGDAELSYQNFDRALEIYTNDCKNDYPSNIAQNIRISNSITKARNQKYAYDQKKEKERIEQEKLNKDREEKTQAYDPNNGVLKYKDYIKNKLYELAGLEVVYGKKATDEDYRVIKDYLESKLNRKLTKYDLKVINEISDEIVKEAEMVNKLTKSTQKSSTKQSSKNQINVCKWCSNSFSHNGFDYEKNGSQPCKARETNPYGVSMMGSVYTGDYCSRKCAIEACENRYYR